MFTGLVQATGQVVALEVQASGVTRLTLSSPLLAAAELGASIAVNGCCLTATSVQGNVATFDLLAETLRLTNLGDLKVGSLVNLEPSLRPTDRMGGHFVTGHIDACGSVEFFGADGADWRLDINAPADVLRYVVKKGCVAVDGMSLTVADVLPAGLLGQVPAVLEDLVEDLGRLQPAPQLPRPGDQDRGAGVEAVLLGDPSGQRQPGLPIGELLVQVSAESVPSVNKLAPNTMLRTSEGRMVMWSVMLSIHAALYAAMSEL